MVHGFFPYLLVLICSTVRRAVCHQTHGNTWGPKDWMAALSTRGIAHLLPADAAAAPPIALNADHELASGRRPC